MFCYSSFSLVNFSWSVFLGPVVLYPNFVCVWGGGGGVGGGVGEGLGYHFDTVLCGGSFTCVSSNEEGHNKVL